MSRSSDCLSETRPACRPVHAAPRSSTPGIPRVARLRPLRRHCLFSPPCAANRAEEQAEKLGTAPVV